MVVLSGAGISAESGLKTFRGQGGLWEGHEMAEVATPGAWARNVALVLDFYNLRRREVLRALPNRAHAGIAALERDYKITVVTQNIDDLHERAGSTRVIHLHGEILKARSSLDPGLEYPITADIFPGDLAGDGSQLRPSVVWFGEPVPLIETAAARVMEADVVVVIGTSLNVYPAAGLLDVARPDAKIFVIDPSIPVIRCSQEICLIEKSATEGVGALRRLLAADGSGS